MSAQVLNRQLSEPSEPEEEGTPSRGRADVAVVMPAVAAWTRLLRAHASTTRLLSADLQREHGLTINDYEALLVLSRAPELRLRRVDLARRLLLTPSGVTRLLEGLERAGLVERVACPGDLRVAYARLTEAGAARLRAASCAHVGSVRALMEGHLTAAEIDQLAALLARLPGVEGEDEACTAGQGAATPGCG